MHASPQEIAAILTGFCQKCDKVHTQIPQLAMVNGGPQPHRAQITQIWGE